MDRDHHQTRSVPLISDAPAADTLQLGYSAYARTLARLIATKDNATPFILGIYGPWGSGKTTLMKAVQRQLDEGNRNPAAAVRQCKTVWFRANAYDCSGQCVPAMVEAIFKAMAADGFFGLAKSRIEEIARRIDKSTLYPSLSRLAAGMDVSEFFFELEDKRRLAHFDTFHKFFDDLVWTFLNWRFKIKGEEKPDDRRATLVIFVDDLDQCRPDSTMAFLDAVKRFAERSGGVFVLGANRQKLARAIVQEHGQADAGPYLERIVQVAFTLPPPAPEAFAALLDPATDGVALLKTHLPLLVPTLGYSPRKLKRFVNQQALLVQLLRQANVPIDADTVMRWSLIQQCFDEAAAYFKDQPDAVVILQQQIKKLSKVAPGTPPWEIGDARLEEAKVPPPLRPLLKQPHLADLLEFLDTLPDATLVELQRLSAAVG
jgi:iron(II)-dependent oxidoreductase